MSNEKKTYYQDYINLNKTIEILDKTVCYLIHDTDNSQRPFAIRALSNLVYNRWIETHTTDPETKKNILKIIPPDNLPQHPSKIENFEQKSEEERARLQMVFDQIFPYHEEEGKYLLTKKQFTVEEIKAYISIDLSHVLQDESHSSPTHSMSQDNDNRPRQTTDFFLSIPVSLFGPSSSNSNELPNSSLNSETPWAVIPQRPPNLLTASGSLSSTTLSDSTRQTLEEYGASFQEGAGNHHRP